MILLLVLWYITGVCSFIYWHTKHYKLSWDHFMYAFSFGFFGPITFFALRSLFSKYHPHD